MKNLLNIIRYILVVILLIVLIVLVGVKMFGNRAVKTGIEKAASNALKVGVTVQDVDLSIVRGKLNLKGLVIDNPEGYEHERLLELEDARIAVVVKSLLGEKVHIKDLQLDGVKLVVEQKDVTGNNLQEVLNALAESKEKNEPSGKTLQIDNLEISDVTVNVKLLPVPGKTDTVTLELTPIKMAGLGSDSKMDVALLSSKILMAIAEGITKQGMDVLPKEIVDTMVSALGKTIDLSKKILGDDKSVGKKTLKDAEDIGKEITNGLKGLLKKKERE